MATPMSITATTSTIVAVTEFFEEDEVPIMLVAGCITASLIRNERKRCMGYHENTVPAYLPDTFKRFFRMERSTTETLCRYLSQCPEITARDFAGGRPEVPLDKKVLITLRYLGSQETVREIGDRFNVTDSTVISCKRQVVSALANSLKTRFVKWPGQNELDGIAQAFDDMGNYHFPGIIGAIDGCHIEIEAPSENPNAYYNRKQFHSIILQGVCNHELVFTSINVGWPGRVHDAKVFRNSKLFDSGFVKCQNGHFHLVGDAAYPIKSWLMTPYRDNGHLTNRQRRFNTALSSKRQVIERAFAMIKGRFRRLKHVHIIDIPELCENVVSVVVLHNICRLENDDFEEFFDDQAGDQPPPVLVFDDDDHAGVAKRQMIANQL